jgi:hypothetical protein
MKTFWTLTLSLLCLSINSLAQTCGSLKIAGFGADAPDQIRFIATQDIPGGTTFYFTDKAWSATTENFPDIDFTSIFSWTSPVGGVNVWSVIVIQVVPADGSNPATFTVSCGSANGIPNVVSPGMPGLSNDGEQVYVTVKMPSAAPGSITDDDICFAVKFLGSGDMPSAGKFVDVGDIDNAAYKGSGDITDVANWNRSNNLTNTPITFLQPSCLPASALPVTLSSFMVNTVNQKNRIAWTTTSESSNHYFEVQRSSDAISFTAIGSVQGSGDSQKQETYQFTDEVPKAGVNYYRLKQVDFDGQFELSRIIRTVNDGGAGIAVKSAPESRELIVSGVSGDATYRLVNLDGRTVKAGQLAHNDMAISHKQISRGLYVLQIQNAHLSYTKKVLIE